jgi:DNA-binding NtrC family response regulator
LNERVAEGLFRDDLLYRVNVVSITVPPLRQRQADIRPLTNRFIAQACETHHRRIAHVAEGCYRMLERYEWPGNIRQLRNVIESAVLLCPGTELTEQAISLPPTAERATADALDTFELPEGMTLETLERTVLLKTLQRYQGNRTLTAERLGLSRRTIQRKAKEYGLPF